MASMPTFRLGLPHGAADPTLGWASQDSKAVFSPKRIWPWGFRFCSTFSRAPQAEDVQGMCARLHGYCLLSCLNFKELVCHHPNTLSYPVTALLAEENRTYLGNTLQQRPTNNSPNQGIIQISPECNSIPACLIDPKWNKSMSLIKLTPETNTSTVVSILSCHLAQVLHDKLCSSQLHTSSKQGVLLPKWEQKARVYFKQAIRMNRVWNTLSCPQVKHYLLVFWLTEVNSASFPPCPGNTAATATSINWGPT